MTALSDQLVAEHNRLSPTYMSALRFEAPYVIEKLVKNRTADSEDDAHLLFREAKRYLVLAQSDRATAWQMHSLRVDEAWHQFVLFTVQYADFAARYSDLFGEEVPAVWFDAETLTDDRRLINEHVGELIVDDAGDMAELVGPGGAVLFRVSALARDALFFVSTTGSFHVRELPGDLTIEERTGLARALVAARLLRVCG